MPVSTTNAISGPLLTNGVTTTFPFTFTAPSTAEVQVISRNIATGVDTIIASGFTVTLTNGGGGSVVFDAAPATGAEIYLLLDPDFTQDVEIADGAKINARDLNQMADRSAARDQFLRYEIERAIRYPVGETAQELTGPDGRINTVLGFDENGDFKQYEIGSFATSVAFATARSDTFEGDGAQTAFVLTLSPGTVNNCQVFIDGVRQTPTADYTLSSNTLTFTTAPHDGALILVTYAEALTLNEASGEDVSFYQAGTGAVFRTAQDKMRDTVSVRDFGVTGEKIADAIAAHQSVFFPTGTYNNTTVSVTFPFGKTIKLESGANLIVSGSGSFTYSGVTIREGYNPGAWTGWTDAAGENFEGFSVDLGGYGARSFGGFNTPAAISGSTRVPASATIFAHANGTSGWVRNESTTTGAVALYGEANRDAASSLVWGLNTRTIDNGFGDLNIWGYECNLNIDNVNTIGLGIDLVGGSTVEPALSVAVNVQAIGVFETPKKRWQYGLRTVGASCVIGIELGPQTEGANSPSQIFQMRYINGSNVIANGLAMQVDSSGNAVINGGTGSTLFALRTPASTQSNIQLLGDGIGFFGAFPTGKPTVSGSRGGNAALASLLTALADMGLITNSTTA